MSKSFRVLFNRQVPTILLPVVAALSALLVYYFFRSDEKGLPNRQVAPPSAAMEQIRSHDQRLVSKLVLADLPQESPTLSGIKSSVLGYINSLKAEHRIVDASVYFRQLDNGAWFVINENQTYNPASLIKVAYLIAYLKTAEGRQGYLDQKIRFEQHAANYSQNIRSSGLTEGKDYSIRTLLEHMIIQSDNDATLLLQQHADMEVFNQLFDDLHIPRPDFSREYFIGVADYSKFFRVLYNGSYLGTASSEFALGMLTKSEFAEGIVAAVGKDATIAHKFGERVLGDISQLHEVGIVYQGNRPYLIAIMTSGNDLKSLSGVIREITQRANQGYVQLTGQ